MPGVVLATAQEINARYAMHATAVVGKCIKTQRLATNGWSLQLGNARITQV